MTTVIFRFVIALVVVSVCAAVHKKHEICGKFCVSMYGTQSDIENACQRGCRLYGMIFLAHDRSVERSEIAGLCKKSCSATSASTDSACNAGCARQERVFREFNIDNHTARLAVMFGLPSAPLVHSPTPYHGRIFARMHPQLSHQGPTPHAWLRAVRIHIRPLPVGTDGRPRYWVEISEHRIPLRFVPGSHHQLQQQLWHHSRNTATGHTFMSRISHLTHRAGFRWAACALLIASLIGLLWFCCGFFCSAKAPRVRVLRLTAVLRKQAPTSVQSGDIFSVNTDKKPLLLAEETTADSGKPKSVESA